MDWLNYHHLRYFWMVAREGGLRPAAEKLHVSQPSISAQIHELEATLGQKLFRRSGRGNVLTDAGQIAFRFAEEIFALGQELNLAITQRPSLRAVRFHVGVVDSLPKLVTHDLLRRVYALPQVIHLVCREGKITDLLAQLAAHRLDLVVADEPASSSVTIRAFNHLVSESDVTFCAQGRLAARLRRGFPRSLHQAPALLPTETTGLRRSLEQWFHSMGIRPRVVAEFEDAALMKEMAADGRGFTAVPANITADVFARYHLRHVGTTGKCRSRVYAITAERHIQHPALALLTRDVQVGGS